MPPQEHLDRYGRQMLLQGAEAQNRLNGMSVLLVGAGALGCACLPYLAGAGVGVITICDGDVVEIGNLHRQPLHDEAGARLKMNKAESAAARLRSLNSTIQIVAVARHVDFDDWTLRIVADHDIVCDCSDNVGTRYLLNDACFLGGKKTLISAAALGGEGTIAIYDFQANTSCYRCAHPEPSTFEARRSCAERGVIGPVPGVLGSLQALEVLKCVGISASVAPNQRQTHRSLAVSDVRVFDGRTIRSFRRAPRRVSCALCGSAPSILSIDDSKRVCQDVGLVVASEKRARMDAAPIGFGTVLPSAPMPLPNEACASCYELRRAMMKQGKAILIDVRDEQQFSMCSLAGAVNVPLRELLVNGPEDAIARIRYTHPLQTSTILYLICRRGIDSRAATTFLRTYGPPFLPPGVTIKNIEGGLAAWRADIDPNFPTY